MKPTTFHLHSTMLQTFRISKILKIKLDCHRLNNAIVTNNTLKLSDLTLKDIMQQTILVFDFEIIKIQTHDHNHSDGPKML